MNFQPSQLIFVDQNISGFLKKTISPNIRKENLLVATNDINLKEQLAALGFNVIYIFDYKGDDDAKQALDFLNSWQSKDIAGQDLIDLLSAGGISLWHMLFSYLSFSFLQEFFYYQLLTRVLEQQRIEEVIIIDCPKKYKIIGGSFDRLWPQKILKSIAKKQGLETTIYNFNPYPLGQRVFFSGLSLSYSAIIGRFIFNIVSRKIRERFFKWHRRCRPFASQSLKDKILFVSASSYWRGGLNPLSGHWEKIDTIIYPIIEKLREGFSILAVEPQYLDKNNRALREKICQKAVSWQAFEGYFSARVLIKSLLDYRQLLKRLRPKQTAIKAELFTYQDVDFTEALQAQLNASIKDIFYCLLFLRIAEHLLEKVKPTLALLTYETGPYERAIIAQCQKRGIKTIGLQHGFIAYDTNPDYCRKYNYKPKQSLLPDYLAVYGESAAQSLVRAGYPAQKVKMFGNPEYDFYRNILQTKRQIKLRFMNQQNIPDNKKIVLFLSTNLWVHFPVVDFQKHLQLVYQFFNNHPDYFLIIKLHPSENSALHQQAMRQQSKLADRCRVFQQEAALSELIIASDIVLMFNSTAGYEALFAGVPLISLNFTNYKNLLSYISDGLVPTAKNIQELERYLWELTNDRSNHPKQSGHLNDSLKIYLTNYADGKASWRIANFVRSLLDGSCI